MINEQTVKDIEGAITAIKERGWTQGHYKDVHGHVCLSGAIRVGVWGTPYQPCGTTVEQWDRINDVNNLVSEVVDDSSISRWNDQHKRKKRHVLKALEEAKIQATKGI